jgi:superfamily II DNA or RNA helicase
VTFAPGTLVRARGREWVVLPDSEPDFLVVRPLGGTDEEIGGIATALEKVEPATFPLPDPKRAGEHYSARLLRDAVRLGFRSSAGPFRSFGNLGIEPRPYQLVPLLMAMKQNPVRLLIADDVGIGKTIEAALIAKELIDRGEARRLAVLCPPQLAEQWQKELKEKFHIDAVVVLPGTAARLERGAGLDQSLFDLHPHVIVSTDFIKAEKRRHDFLRTCPELVIVDEAHSCVSSMGVSGQQRHELVKGLAQNPERHLILVTATPHSGKDDAFRSLVALLDETFSQLPEDLSGGHNESNRKKLARHFIQRRRENIKKYLGTETDFPDRDESDETYTLSKDYRKLFDKVVGYARELVRDDTTNRHRMRVRWWSALALLQALASSPAAAAASLRSRSETADTESAEQADQVGRAKAIEGMLDQTAEAVDLVPGGDSDESDRRLEKLAKEAEALGGKKDEKVQVAIKIAKELIKDGHNPIFFCRFIATAEYLKVQLEEKLPKTVTIEAVTGLLPPEEREQRVTQLGEAEKRILVATDCLSEGINLQHHFDAVVHYDLSWNPTRHEQREGRVDRYGQPNEKVKIVRVYGVDNQIDGIVLDVLLRKHESIRRDLGVSVPIPADGEEFIEAVFEGLLFRENGGLASQTRLEQFDQFFRPKRDEFHKRWDKARDKEKKTRSIFAHETISVDEVRAELQRVREAVGIGTDVETFVLESLRNLGAVVSSGTPVRIDLGGTPPALRDATGEDGTLAVRFNQPAGEGEHSLTRTHPFVAGLASYVMETALDPEVDGAIARRCGVILTTGVTKQTVLLLLRHRFHIHVKRGRKEIPLLAEETSLAAFRGTLANAEWLPPDEAEALLGLKPDANIAPDLVVETITKLVDRFDEITPRLDAIARARAAELLTTHSNVRAEARLTGVSYRVEPQLPVDVLGIYVYRPRVAQ